MAPRRAGQPFRRVGKLGNTSYGPRKPKTVDASSLRSGEGTSQNEKLESTRLAHRIDETMGFARFDSGKKKVGWLVNMHSTTIEDEDVPGGRAGVDFYFIGDEGDTFKATLEYDPYFLLAIKKGREQDVEEYCKKSYEGLIKSIKTVEKEDLSMPNHLTGYRRKFLQLTFANVNDLLAVRKAVAPVVEKNKKNVNAMDTYAEVANGNGAFDFFDNDEYEYEKRFTTTVDASDFILDIREYDVPYHVRVAIDKDVRIGNWYTVEAKHGVISIKCIEDRLTPADPVVMAYDIETTKLPLKFPDAAIDQIMMISYMIDGQGFLITNREIVSEDISDFEYTPKPEYQGPFMIFNEPDEKGVLERFFEHIKEAKPTVMVTYNGDFFDWPFVEARASVQGIDMYQEIGFRKNSEDIYQSDYCAHMDAFSWVSRDSYLPQGSRGLKAVTMAKLGYDPDELDPELMTPYAAERPQTLAEYSVSDAVATYYLYMKYVHPFIFALCKILPLGPDDALRKGTGTLCEMLLMVQAYQKGIVLPNKHQAPKEAFWEGHLLESETYVGGHVEALEAGVFRSDIAYNFAVDPTAIDELLHDLDAALKFSIEVEEKKKMEDVVNYDEIKAEIVEKLMQLKTTPNRNERPLIYHLDVASMYPNIMTTNRLQPDSMIDESNCAACDFNRPGKTCDRRMPWAWRGEYLPAKRDEYNMVRNALENEQFPGRFPNSPKRTFQELSEDEQATLIRKRLTDYSKKIYHKVHDATTIEREAIICQRENPFYVDTVSGFRDRRYDFKGKQKVWKGKTEALKAAGAPATEVEDAKKMIVLFDSMQLAHKVILNSFYGYVMRKGSRWYSLEMAGVTCLTGARIIQLARSLVERIGRPLELDTDGIWAILPATFPENFAFKLSNGKKLTISYPCTMLNHLVHAQYTNHQYETLVDPETFRYEKHSDNSIFFEVDGPYKAMILPTSKEEDKNLKKRYAVFNHDGSLAELKGFEVKRRGELKLIKNFQAQIFKFFLEGTTLEETYGAVAKVANRWLDILDTRGATLADEELIDLIVENKSMTKTLEEYGAQKSTAITTAKRLAEFLGEQMVKDKGLNCKYIISKTPRNAPVTERAVPLAIFSAEETVKRYFLRKWLRDDPGEMDLRSILDWDYYRERLASVIQKLITIPAAYQKVRNPVPRVPHPDWLDRRIRQKEDKLQQTKMTDMFSKKVLTNGDANVANNKLSGDFEDFGSAKLTQNQSQMKKGIVTKMVAKRKEPEPAVPIVDPYAALPKVMPSIDKDYSGWLMYQKQKWKIQREARKRRRQLFGEKAVDASDAIGSFFRNQAQSLYISTWQLVQLRPTETPGEVRAFVLIDKKIHALKIIVPRQLYLNLRSEDLPDVSISGCSVEKVVNHSLPNGHPSIHLFKLQMSEETYVQEANSISALFNHSSVEGVYEKHVPLNIRAILELGSTCTFDESQKGVLGKGLEQGFDLSALRKVPTKEPYLAEAPFNYLYLYHVSSGDRNIYGIFSTSKNEAHIVIQNKSKDSQGMPNVDRIYRDALQRRMEDSNGEPWQTMIEYQDDIHFKTTMVTTKRKALLEVGDIVKKMKADESGPMIVVMQSPNQALLSHDIPILKELPILPLHPDETDKQLPPLGWQAFIARRLVGHYLDLGSWVAHLLELARYGDVPLCNLESNDPRFLIDIAYARRLQKERVILWWSGQAKPDHAGYEKDDILGPLETVDMPSVNNPGTYSSVCIDINLRNLAINTILSSSLVNELEGADSVSFNPSYDSTGDGSHVIVSDNAFAGAGITVLREMVKAWWVEAIQAGHGFSMADVMVQHLVRWVSSPGSFLYDRALHYYVQMMSKKTLQQLMTDFKRVGSHIVFASPNRLLLQTTKAEVGNAYAYSQYIIKTIKSKPLFQFMELEIKEYWDYLVWYDEFNYGGKGCNEVTEDETQPVENIMCWQLAQFLPPKFQPTFNDWVVEFIELMHARKRPGITEDGSTPRVTQIPLRPLTVDPNEQTQILPKQFTRPLSKQMNVFAKKQHAEVLDPLFASDYVFPELPGSHLKLTNPVLQLVKSIMQVLSLDRAISLEARALRKELLNLFDIREFSAEASFTNPSAALVVRGVICDDCTSSRDLDLCRDSSLLPVILPDSDAAPVLPKWKCDNCESTYDKRRIEEQLVGEVQKMVLEWCTQDLKCGKCKRLRSNEFMEHCACAGEWVATKNKQEIKRKMNVYGNVARFYTLGMLEAVVEECLESF
ncbi:DNA polymerase epsilon catalytic subunit [Alternaria sp. BMP 0032]|nr:DNA polymerase epsilon catalytic subunit [Alternaria sp. BMP 0032]